jgi:hypothetical protein
MWTLHGQQQQRGAQLHARGGPPTGRASRRPDEAPAEAVAGREAQEHEHAALDVAGEMATAGESPASPLENREHDITPTVPEPRTSWDEVVQPERRPQHGSTERGDRSRPEDR